MPKLSLCQPLIFVICEAFCPYTGIANCNKVVKFFCYYSEGSAAHKVQRRIRKCHGSTNMFSLVYSFLGFNKAN